MKTSLADRRHAREPNNIILTATLDTNCIIDLDQNLAFSHRQAMENLLKLAEEGKIGLAVTSRVESESIHEHTIRRYRTLIEGGKIGVVASTTRLGFWKLGVDILPDENLWKELARAVYPNRDPEILFRPKGQRVKGYLDIDHLYGHLQSSRSFFVTRDTKILRARRRLAALGIRAREPQELVREILSSGVRPRVESSATRQQNRASSYIKEC